MRQIPFLFFFSLVIGLYAGPASAKEIQLKDPPKKTFQLKAASGLAIEKTADQEECLEGEGETCTFTITITNEGAPYSGEIVMSDWEGTGGQPGIKLISISAPWGCNGNGVKECTHPPITLGQGESRTFKITLEYPKGYKGLYSNNCVIIGSTKRAKGQSSESAPFMDCALVEIKGKWPSTSTATPSEPGWPSKSKTPAKSSTGLGALPEPGSSTSAASRPRKPTGRTGQPAAAGRLPSAPASPSAPGAPGAAMALPRR